MKQNLCSFFIQIFNIDNHDVINISGIIWLRRSMTVEREVIYQEAVKTEHLLLWQEQFLYMLILRKLCTLLEQFSSLGNYKKSFVIN